MRRRYPVYSGGGASRSSRISCITRRKFSTSARSPSTSVGESDDPPALREAECVLRVAPGDSGSRLDADPACDPACDPTFDDPDSDSAYASRALRDSSRIFEDCDE